MAAAERVCQLSGYRPYLWYNLFGVKLDLRGNSAADPFMGDGFFCSPAACRRE
jgi:hypothetical protein